MRKRSSQKAIFAGAVLAGVLSGGFYFGLANWKSAQVEAQSELAISTCGKGNVLNVTATSFSCK